MHDNIDNNLLIAPEEAILYRIHSSKDQQSHTWNSPTNNPSPVIAKQNS